MTHCIKAGVFFNPPPRLPRGRHDLSREEVLKAQAERLMIAVTELMADVGYLAVGVREIATRAGVSRGAFYECFDSKEACVYAAYDRFLEVLLGRFSQVQIEDGSLDSFIAGMLEAYLGLMEDDPVTARAIQVEFDALGSDARERRRAGLRKIAEFIRNVQQQLLDEDGRPALPRPLNAYVGVVYACRQIAIDQLDLSPQPELRSMIPELASWAAASLRVSERRATPREIPSQIERRTGTAMP